LPLRDGQELLRAVRRDGNRLGTEGGRALHAADEARPCAGRSRCGEADLALSAPRDAVAVAVEADGDADRRAPHERRLGAWRAEYMLEEGPGLRRRGGPGPVDQLVR